MIKVGQFLLELPSGWTSAGGKTEVVLLESTTVYALTQDDTEMASATLMAFPEGLPLAQSMILSGSPLKESGRRLFLSSLPGSEIESCWMDSPTSASAVYAAANHRLLVMLRSYDGSIESDFFAGQVRTLLAAIRWER